MSKNTNQAGKGSKPRPVDKKKFNENFDSIIKQNKPTIYVKEIVKKLNKTTYKY